MLYLTQIIFLFYNTFHRNSQERMFFTVEYIWVINDRILFDFSLIFVIKIQ